MARNCPKCKKVISGHPNKKFCNQKCKDAYHNSRWDRDLKSHLRSDPKEAESYFKQKQANRAERIISAMRARGNYDQADEREWQGCTFDNECDCVYCLDYDDGEW